MNKSDTVRLGIIGLGNMGTSHADKVLGGEVPGLELTAIADSDPTRLEKYTDITKFSDAVALIESSAIDAVLIATPHYDHTALGIAALQAGLHTLVEKPISVHKADCERLIAAHTNKDLVFAAMFNQRTDPAYLKLRELIQSGELGAIQRINWIITDWYRTETYYRSGGWRATWGGEGGGVLLNQCPHNLDLLQWLFGMPSKITANCQLGRFHNIEVEDAVTALLEYPSGATGVFITSTGEAPGTNRLEVAADHGKIVIENGSFKYTRTETLVPEHLETATTSFGKPEAWNVEIPIIGNGEQHVGIMKNFTNAILKGDELLAPAAKGIHSVELANAMLHSGFERTTVELPLDAALYEKALKKRIETSTYIKPEVIATEVTDMSSSF